jgi:hypothetical protein
MKKALLIITAASAILSGCTSGGYAGGTTGAPEGPDLACRTDSFDSTAIDHTFYCSDGTLKVTFTTQETEYTYCNVPEAVYFDGLLRADSAGSYFNDNIRDQYDTAKNGEC